MNQEFAHCPNTAATQPPAISVILPCLNESSSVVQCIEEAKQGIAATGEIGEILVVDNGSTDCSAEKAAQAGAIVIREPRRGYGSAILAGLRQAQGKYWIIGDADGSYDFTQIPTIIAWHKQGFGLVVGNRFSGTIHKSAMPWLNRYLGNPFLTTVGRLLHKVSLHDFHCGLRGIEASICSKLGLECTGMEFASEMIIKAARNGIRTAEFPTSLRPRKAGHSSHLRPFRDGFRHLKLLIFSHHTHSPISRCSRKGEHLST